VAENGAAKRSIATKSKPKITKRNKLAGISEPTKGRSPALVRETQADGSPSQEISDDSAGEGIHDCITCGFLALEISSA